MTDEAFKGGPPPPFSELIERHRATLERFLRSHARGVLRFEAEDDLVQGVMLRAYRGEGHFSYRGERAFVAWLLTVARQHVASRHKYWSAEKRVGGELLRITEHMRSAPSDRTERGGVTPAAASKGPATRAENRELTGLAMRAVRLLLPRDQELVRAVAVGMPLADLAVRLGIGPDAAERARLRALERFRKAFEVLRRRAGEPPSDGDPVKPSA